MYTPVILAGLATVRYGDLHRDWTKYNCSQRRGFFANYSRMNVEEPMRMAAFEDIEVKWRIWDSNIPELVITYRLSKTI
jgi:hypothetical protein